MKRKHSLSALVLGLCSLPVSGQLVISQYYEGASNNKYIELTNAGTSTVDLSTYALTLWSNGASENWKSEGGSPNSTQALIGNLAAGATLVIANSNAASPLAASSADLTSGVANFNGNDSVVLYNGVVGTVADIVDAIAFTSANEGANTSVVRLSTDVGFDTNFGSSFLIFPTVWSVVATDTVDQAVAGSDNFLGASALGSALPGLGLALDPTNFSEGAGAAATTGTVTRSGDLSQALVVTLASADETELTVPSSVTIEAGSATATFEVTAVDDTEQDFDQTVRIVASADGFSSANVDAIVEDDEASLEITIDMESIAEQGGTATATVTVSEPSDTDYILNLTSSDTSEATVPQSVTIPANQTSVTFMITAVDDSDSDGSQSVTISVSDSAALLAGVTSTIVVTDDEDLVVPELVINELRTDNQGNDTEEYLEIYSATPDFSLGRIWLIVLGDLPADASGTVERVYDLSSFSATGNYFLIGSNNMGTAVPDFSAGTNIFENGDTLTFLLVTDFTGSLNDDLDTDNDGTLDVTPWGEVIDAVSIIDADVPGSSGAFGYAEGLGFAGANVTQDGEFPPSHVFRSPDATGAFFVGPFGSIDEPVTDTPGGENGVAVTPPGAEEIMVRGFSSDRASGRTVITVTGLGTATWLIQSSDDLGVADSWEPISGNYTESDNADGSTDLIFFDSLPTVTKRFYRLIEE